jgi:hypothetical protein
LSPTCPYVSLTSLKRSRSLKIVAKNQLFRLAEQLLVRCEQGTIFQIGYTKRPGAQNATTEIPTNM